MALSRDERLVAATGLSKGSRRKVPLTAATTELLRDYLAKHPRADNAAVPLFPPMTSTVPKPTGVRATDRDSKPAARQAAALAELNVADAEARIVLDWENPLRHATFYKAVFRAAVLRANRLTPTATFSPGLKFHSLRHTYASLCAAAGIKPLEIARFMGHANVTTTLTVYTHLFADDHSDAMAALGAMATLKPKAGNVIPLHG
jgi:integrase